MNEMQIFNNPEFGQVRTLIVDGVIWFVGIDVARALGYKKAGEALQSGVDEMDSTLMGVMDSKGREQKTKVINESGLYSLIFGSRLDSAKRFKKWVTSEVLPSIRKNGTYGTPQLPQSPMELLELHYQAIKQVDGKVNILSDNLEGVKKDFETFKNDMPILGIEESRITNAVHARGVRCLGGKGSNAYKNRALRGKLYADLYHQLKREFGVSSYPRN